MQEGLKGAGSMVTFDGKRGAQEAIEVNLENPRKDLKEEAQYLFFSPD